MTSKNQTLSEEIANSITHGVGIALSIAALIVLVVIASQEGDTRRIVSFSIYGASLILLYSASTFYHSFQSPKLKHVFHVMDHSFIYILIAGTYTPFTLIPLRGAWGWSLFGIIWGLAIAGIVFKIFFVDRFRRMSPVIYIAMGRIVIVAAKPMIDNIPSGGLLLLLAGGLSYTGGVVFYAWKKLPYNHAIWHLFVLGGSVCHFLTIYFYILPNR